MSAIAQREHPVEALLRPKALVVTVLASEALAVVLSLTHPLDADWPVRLGLLSLSLLWITITALCGLALCRPLLRRLPTTAFPWLALTLLVLATGAVAHTGWTLTRSASVSDDGYSMFMLRAIATALVVGMLALLIYQNYLQGREAAIGHKEAELAVLRARVQPHFLFNTLNTGIALLHNQPERAERLLLDLSDLFRAAFSGPAVGPLRAEIALAQQYLAIESLRFAERLDVQWVLPDEDSPLLDTQLPALSLQPLVENAIKHGIEPSLLGGRLEISIEPQGAQVLVRVRNTMPNPPSTSSRGHGIGLDAVRARTESFGDGSGRLQAGPDADGNFVAVLTLPR
ncbi:sensor histidine kinase [Luteimonas terrae]|uniref:Two-component system sensor histidine kinase AlgZ n=1 Tax=Luteimonas terrae TaxID=1530191 RepID=A0ABU1XRW9_9GAMM|nr:histidine kinase [Luteimonas terrae]MDR7191492.1 two-component system sensor histidine kinase AlgZ [Luteimonas terrae]